MFKDIVLAFGGNVPTKFGSCAKTISNAIRDATAAGLEVGAISRFFNTPGFPTGTGPDYVNAVVTCRTEHSPNDVLDILHKIEHKYGRTRDLRWGSRTLDIDLIAMNDMVLPDLDTFRAWRKMDITDQKTKAPEQLVLPHPRLQDRAFVLVPMSDVAPDWRHPVSGLSTLEMLTKLPVDEITSVVPITAL